VCTPTPPEHLRSVDVARPAVQLATMLTEIHRGVAVTNVTVDLGVELRRCDVSRHLTTGPFSGPFLRGRARWFYT
jgi:hypothetical protein